MELFTVLFYTGILGILASFALGFARLGHHRGQLHQHGGGAPSLKGISKQGDQGGLNLSAVHHSAHADQLSQSNPDNPTSFGIGPFLANLFVFGLSIVSPLNIFAFCLAFGAAGLLIGPHLQASIALVAAIVVGLTFTFALIRPLMGFLLKFESTPALGLEGAKSRQVTAVSGFDDSGRGIVLVELDGQLRQVLAQLDKDELKKNVKVQKSDSLMVIDVDTAANKVVVSKDLA